MVNIFNFSIHFFLFGCIFCLSVRKDHSIINPSNGDPDIICTPPKCDDAGCSIDYYANPCPRCVCAEDDCDPSTVPVMADFDMKKFSGTWFELAKTRTGYIDVADGAWSIEVNNASTPSYNFLFSGRDNNQHCIRPIKGTISAAHEPPGLITLRYKTYSTHVEETVRVLFTDYTTIAVIYSCMHHVHTDKEVCHAAGLFGAIWTRNAHVGVEVYEKATNFLELACIHKSSLMVRNLIGPCRIDQWDFRIDDFPAPDYCYQIMDLGSCTGYLQRYYYDAKEKTCKQFTFGGCGGNNNNFLSLSECQKKCAVASNKDPVCMSTAKCALHCSPCCTEDNNGCVQCDCEHIVEDTILKCVSSPSQCPDECDAEYIYQGCHICNCGDDDLGVCNEVKSYGSCKDSIERYYYNAIDVQCEKFTYSGCGGNNNNFQTLQECRERCTHEMFPDITIEKTPPKQIDNSGDSVSNVQAIPILLITAVSFVVFYLTVCIY